MLPVDRSYAPLLAALGDRVNAVAKDLEVYAGDEPPAGYGLELEVGGILRAADAAGFRRFHLVGYSGGGAAGLAFAAAQGGRLLSLALIEPAWAGNRRTPREAALHERFAVLQRLPPDEQLAEFARLQLAPDVEPPPPPEGPPPPWLALRPRGIRALLRAFDEAELDLDALRSFRRPVWYALGGRSNPDYFAEIARRLAEVVPDFTVETFAECHHFDPPQRSEPERVAESLLALWRAAEERAP